MTLRDEVEIVDDAGGIVLRRVVVGPLDTNCWIVIDVRDRRAVIVDPGDEPHRILDACADLDVGAVLLTHAHWDHVLGLPDVADTLGVAVLAHPDERPVWAHECLHLHRHGHFDAGTATDRLLADGFHLGRPADRALWAGRTTDVRDRGTIPVGDDVALTVLHTPGHTPGGISFRAGGHVLTGDTLFPGGPGLTGWPLSDFPTIIHSIRHRLFRLPSTTQVHPGHGRSTTIGAERPRLDSWITRGW